jgi:hypothetical protein
MRLYRFAWGIVASVVVVPACVFDVVSGGLLRMTAVGSLLAFLGGTLAFVLAEDRDDRTTWVGRAVLWCGAGAAAMDALVATWGPAGMAAGGVLALTAPACAVLFRAQFVAWSSRRAAGPPETLAIRDLRRRWEWTTNEVRHPDTSAPRRLALVEERRTLLDELQRRDPDHFDDWVVHAVPARGAVRPRPRGT